jgi:hemolysin activation/secretion protein
MGANRLGASLQINEPTGLGDVATARVLTSGEGLAYGRVSYQALVGWVNLGLAYTTLHYRLGGDFASTQSSGTARVGSVYANYALIRSRNSNLNAQWSLDNKAFSDQSDAVSSGASADKSAQVSTATLRGDFRSASGTGSTNYAVTWTRGRISLRDPMALLIDANSAHSDGAFDKLTYALARQQAATTGTDVYLGVNGQWASKNLDASEKFSLGGVGGVRAYPSGEATGDEGVIVALESRTLLPGLSDRLSGPVQLIGFIDAGTVRLNKTPWDTSGAANQRTLSGGGVGLAYAGPGNLMVRAYAAFKFGSEAATSAPDAAGRFWLQVNKTF